MDANYPDMLLEIDGPGDDYRPIYHSNKPMRRANLSAEEIEKFCDDNLLLSNHLNHERRRRYLLIDEITGHVWGDVVAADPIKACRAIDARCSQLNREYTDIGSAPFDGHSGYHVYLATSAYNEYATADGDDAEFIKAVEAMPFVTRVAIESRRGG
jgi:hypothetical protein